MKAEILDHFKHVDPMLYKAAQRVVLPPIEVSADYFRDLCSAIIGQQLSGKAADTIFQRFESLFPNQNITPEAVEKLTLEQIRAIGASNAKSSYIKDLAAHVVHGKLEIAKLGELSDEQLKTELVAVKGIGPWTAEMFLIFSLGRPDVFSPGDLGLKKGMQKLYKLSELPTEKEATKLSLKWAPYRSFASRVLWKLLDTKE